MVGALVGELPTPLPPLLTRCCASSYRINRTRIDAAAALLQRRERDGLGHVVRGVRLGLSPKLGAEIVVAEIERVASEDASSFVVVPGAT